MTTTAHTPGPWEVGQPRTIFPVGERSLAVAVAERHRPEHDANARLIAAAPDLLAACVALVDSFEKHRPKELWDAARAAIARATGAA